MDSESAHIQADVGSENYAFVELEFAFCGSNKHQLDNCKSRDEIERFMQKALLVLNVSIKQVHF